MGGRVEKRVDREARKTERKKNKRESRREKLVKTRDKEQTKNGIFTRYILI